MPTDTTRVAELLREIEQGVSGSLRGVVSCSFVGDRIREALRALGDEGREKWTADKNGADNWCVWKPRPKRIERYMLVAQCDDEATAKRIAALPRLERAAREVVERFTRSEFADGSWAPNRALKEAVTDLRAALDEPGGQP